ncbi:MAG: hypothetical protein R3C12_07105 [Planctomycetaceae bacterium]
MPIYIKIIHRAKIWVRSQSCKKPLTLLVYEDLWFHDFPKMSVFMTRYASGLLLILVLSAAALAESVRCPVAQDNSIVMVDGEWSVNAGASGRIRIKGNQHIVAMSFDLSAVQGKKHQCRIC